MEAADEIVKGEPEFIVYANLSRRLEQGKSAIVEVPARGNDDFSRQGLRWVTALARVELGAMLAGYAEHPQPFAAVSGGNYDAAEYREMIIDGAKMHFWSFTHDAQIERVFKQFKPNATTLAYLRRLNVASAFIQAAMVAGQFGENTPQGVELFESGKQLAQARSQIRSSIEAYLSKITASTKNDLLEMCLQGACRTFDGASSPPAAKP